MGYQPEIQCAQGSFRHAPETAYFQVLGFQAVGVIELGSYSRPQAN